MEATGSSFDFRRPANDERSPDPTVIKGGLVARKGTSIVAEEDHDCIFDCVLGLKLVKDQSYEAIEPADFVVISGVVPADQLSIRMIGRQNDIIRPVGLGGDFVLIWAVRVDGCKPEEKGFPWISLT